MSSKSFLLHTRQARPPSCYILVKDNNSDNNFQIDYYSDASETDMEDIQWCLHIKNLISNTLQIASL